MRIISAALLALAGVGGLAAGPATGLEVSGAWIRWLPANLPAAGYLTLTNKGAVPAVLVGASSPDYGQITLHQTRTVHGVSDMVPLDSLSVAVNASVDFAAQGYHLMLMQSRRPLHSGDRVSVTLRFSSGRSMIASFEVRAAAAN